MWARLACKGPARSWWGLDYGRGLLNESVYPSDAMGCVWLGFCMFSRLFLVPPSAGEGRRLSGTGKRVRTFEQIKVHQQHNGGVEHPTSVQQVLQPLLLLTCTVLASPVKPHAQAGCPLLMCHQRALLACLKVSRKLFTFCCWVGFFFFIIVECISDNFLVLEKMQNCRWKKLCCHTDALHLLFLQVVVTLEGIPRRGDEWGQNWTSVKNCPMFVCAVSGLIAAEINKLY